MGGGKASTGRQPTHGTKDSPVDERTITKQTRTHARVGRSCVGAGPAGSARNAKHPPTVSHHISHVILPGVVSDARVTSSELDHERSIPLPSGVLPCLVS